ncbi:MAG TPA: serine/threonine protein kinase, partial [Planctomycetaceae bacterium]|nr:serine/threonine protein kinase [Planctomycetaceae bacterium]
MSDTPADTGSGNLIGTQINDYQVLRRLGRGGMADVYVALHQSLDRQVALKVLRRQLASDSEYVERFRREARAAAKLNHPNIVQVYEVGRSGDHHYIAQELIDGPNLKERVEREGPMAPDEAIGVLRDVSAALAVAHQAGITHRDIKP